MVQLAKALDAETKQALRGREAAKRASQPIREQLLGKPTGKARSAVVRPTKALDESSARTSVTLPEAVPEERRLFLGSTGAIVSPPLHYQWTWDSRSGSPRTVTVSADRLAGSMAFNLWTGGRDAAAWGRAAVGIYFRPITANGILRVRSNPAINANWWTASAFADAHSDGFVGLYVGRYTLAGGPDGVPISQQLRLWSDSTWWSGSSGTVSTTGYPLNAEFAVDSAHWYALWVWCGGHVSGDGEGWAYYGSGGANLSARVPSIAWELFG